MAWPFTQAYLQSIAVLDLVANKPVPAPLRVLVVEQVRAEELTLPLPSGPVRARMYTPVDKPTRPRSSSSTACTTSAWTSPA